MTPILFGEMSRRLFGIHHSADCHSALGAVLLSNPFGHEAIRVHRLFRVMAERLARAGYDVLRFDYFGTGDSAGSDEDGDLDGWVEDFRTAQRELRGRTRATRVVSVGSRLGGSIAMLASTVAPASVALQRLVVWDPIVDGSDYLAALRVKHVESLESSYSLPEVAWRQSLAEDPNAFCDEAIGFALSPALREQLKRLSRDTLSPPPGADLHVVARPEDSAVNAWLPALQAKGVALSHWPLAHSFDWTAGEAMNTAIVPAAVFSRLMSSISD
jgi:pimeloyl-ACP methyl ester carboxylesterase